MAASCNVDIHSDPRSVLGLGLEMSAFDEVETRTIRLRVHYKEMNPEAGGGYLDPRKLTEAPLSLCVYLFSKV